MEGPENISPRLERESVKLIVIFHVVGLIGLSVPASRPYFLGFVPWHLLIMFILVAINHRPIDTKFITFIILIAIAGIAIEYTGVHQHWPFGDYQYGKTLGWQVSGVPLIIGVNWFLLTYAMSAAMRRTKLQRVTSRIVVGSLLLVLLDVLIEPVAIKSDYWHWAAERIPLSNYISWFVISVLMLGVFEAFRFEKQSKVAAIFLLVQFAFFAILNFLVH